MNNFVKDKAYNNKIYKIISAFCSLINYLYLFIYYN